MSRLVRKSMRPLGLTVGAVGLVTMAAGCQVKRNENPNLVVGKQQFVAKCASCHSLARAGAKGIIGPNLDVAFRQSLADGLKRNTVVSVIRDQIENPNPGGAMPRGLLSSSTVTNDVAAYVAQSVDAPGADTGLLASAVPAAGAGKPAVETAGQLEIDADPTGQLAYVTSKATAKAGSVTIVMKNAASVQHNIAIQQGSSGPVLGAGPIVSGGARSTVHVTLKPGTYTYFCQVPGHRAAGMVGTITVK